MCLSDYGLRFLAIASIASIAFPLGGCSTHPAPPAAQGSSNGATSAPNAEAPDGAVDAGILHALESPDASAESNEKSDAGKNDAPSNDASAAPVKSARSGPVRVINIGMHIGGGPNDDVTKEPIHKSVAPHFEAVGQCFPKSAAPPIDFGVDLVIEAKGGKAQVARPRTTLRDDAFIACVVGVFEGIDFLPPRFGKTVVSYSLRFVPAKR